MISVGMHLTMNGCFDSYVFLVCRSPLFHSSSLIPDRPTPQFVFDGALPNSLTPQLPRSDRRGSDSRKSTLLLQQNVFFLYLKLAIISTLEQ
ncbi:unnamed protein product [Strongylus vulgaris]|uniref:Uncharacterized protein n=1 Tax=Strongylus vulgaris TaxID=40348 RepID=A0A3P7JJM2_STRVU|nr:unnamed protein product [Strongylus vulgaris]